jgi:hypothetical protein
MAVAKPKIAETTGAAMDTPIAQPFWRKGYLPVRVGAAVGASSFSSLRWWRSSLVTDCAPCVCRQLS